MCCPSSHRPVLAHSGGDGCRILKSQDSTSPKMCFSWPLVGNSISLSGNSHTLPSEFCQGLRVSHSVQHDPWLTLSHSLSAGVILLPGTTTAKKLQSVHCCMLSRVTLTPWGGRRCWPRRQAGGCVLTCRRHSSRDPLHHCWHVLSLPTLQTHVFIIFAVTIFWRK